MVSELAVHFFQSYFLRTRRIPFALVAANGVHAVFPWINIIL